MNRPSQPASSPSTDAGSGTADAGSPEAPDASGAPAPLEADFARLLRAQEALAHGISHDLRAPLRAVDRMALQLERQLQGGAGAAEATRIRTAVSRMGTLIDSLLEYSRTARATLADDAVDLGFVADWALMDLQDQHPGLAVDADLQPGLKARGDERLLKALFGKLFDNSRRFADVARGVRVQLRGEAGPEGLHLQVSDQGIGMDMRDAHQPFEPFQRLHGASQGAGDGLGLAITQLIVERHGGRIWAESRPGEGTTIHVILPD